MLQCAPRHATVLSGLTVAKMRLSAQRYRVQLRARQFSTVQRSSRPVPWCEALKAASHESISSKPASCNAELCDACPKGPAVFRSSIAVS
jgi:hypothetical protein